MRQHSFTRLLIILALLVISAYIALPLPKPDFVRNLVFWQEVRGR